MTRLARPLTALAAIALASGAQAQPGAAAPSFGTDRLVVHAGAVGVTFNDALVGADGFVLAVGASVTGDETHGLLVDFLPDGTPGPAFRAGDVVAVRPAEARVAPSGVAVLVETAAPAAKARTLGRARMYSLAGTLLPVGAGVALMAHNTSDSAVFAGALLSTAGWAVGPSLGHVYLADVRRTLTGVGIRAGGVAVGALVGALASRNDPGAWVPVEFVVIGGAALVAGTLYSVATLDDSARERGLVVGPAVGAGGHPVLAIALRL